MNIVSSVTRFARRLRFPYLFALTLLVFIADAIVPDPIPFIDEILLALLTMMFGMLRRKSPGKEVQATTDP